MSISARLKTLLEENHIPYTAMAHTTAYTAHVAAAHYARLGKMSSLLGKPTRLATEQEFGALLPDCELGAMPPFGELYGLPIYVDESLAADEEIVFNAGTHHDAIRLSYEGFARLAKPAECALATKS